MITYNKYIFSNLLLRAKGEFQRFYRIKELMSPLRPDSGKSMEHIRIHKPVIIIGCGRSGTSMLFNMLCEHPSLSPTTGFPDGEDTEMWVKIGGAFMAGIGGVRSRAPIGHCFCLPMDETDVSQERIDFFHAYLARKYPRLKNGDIRLLNKNPHLSNKIKYVREIFSDVSLIHVIRHPLGMIASWKVILAMYRNLLFEIPNKRSACMNIYPNRGWNRSLTTMKKVNEDLYVPSDPESIRLLARYWLNVNINILEQLRTMPDARSLKVKYEDICADQNTSLTSILDYLGLPGKTKWRLQARRDSEAKWKKVLSTEELALIEEEIKGDVEGFGYEL